MKKMKTISGEEVDILQAARALGCVTDTETKALVFLTIAIVAPRGGTICQLIRQISSVCGIPRDTLLHSIKSLEEEGNLLAERKLRAVNIDNFNLRRN